ncbi:MAG: ABC transporter ATP-binding protein [Candidatus Nitrosocaldaceae archaeon]
MLASLTYNDSFNIVLETKNLTKIYGSGPNKVVAIDNVNIKIRKGEFVSIIGPSGSGKSTLLNILGGLARPTKGTVLIDGIDIFALNDHNLSIIRNRKIGFVFQSYNLINRTSVLRNIEIPAIIAGIDEKIRRKRIMELLDMLGISDKSNYKPNQLSGGQQQRVAIARALINEPSIILADEPTGNLDTKTGSEVFNILKMLVKKQNRTIIMVTHSPDLADATDKSIILRDGIIEKEVEHK